MYSTPVARGSDFASVVTCKVNIARIQPFACCHPNWVSRHQIIISVGVFILQQLPDNHISNFVCLSHVRFCRSFFLLENQLALRARVAHSIHFAFFAAMGAVVASVRLQLLYWLVFCNIFTSALSLPFIPLSVPQLVPRGVVVNNSSGTIRVFDSSTDQPIPQGPATDGGGTNFSVPAVIWLAFCFVIGAPMAFAGVRGWRLTTGVGIGLPAAACCMISSS